MLGPGDTPGHGLLRRQKGSRHLRRACHPSLSPAPTWADTDWPQILALYSLLAAIDSSPIVRLNRAIALRYIDGAEAALYEVESLAMPLSHYYLFHATRAALLRELGRTAEADRAEMEGIDLTKNSAERALMAERLTDGP